LVDLSTQGNQWIDLRLCVSKANEYFGVELIDYEREGRGILVSSGCGIGMALMDVLSDCRYFVDTDRYRHRSIDWSSLAAILALSDSYLVLAGWFSFDKAQIFDDIERSFSGKVWRYEGGNARSLSEFLQSIDVLSHF
jgi:hypothetical protein